MIKKIYPLILILLFSSSVYAECDKAKALFDEAISYKKNKDFRLALNAFQQAAELCPNYSVLYQQGLTLVKLNRFDDALNSFKKALNHSDKNSKNEANALARIALIYTQKNALQKAGVFIEEAYNINKDNSPDWILRLRKAIDIQSMNHIASASEINQVITSAKRSFGVKPKISFNSITFKFNSTEFTTEGQKQVIELSKALADSNQRALLIGHTDQKGDALYNMELSKRRAEAVKQELINKAPALNKTLETQGKGEEELRYLGNDETDHQLNRRVVMQLL